MCDTQALRSSILTQADVLGTKRRFGLFSCPISTAIGDDGPYLRKLHPREQGGKGKPVTSPKNIYGGPCRTGSLNKSYFGQLNSLTSSDVKDQYVDQAKRLLREENQRYRSLHRNQNKYKPASGTGNNTLCKSSYPYVQQNPPALNPKRNRQTDGRVKTNLRNITSNSSNKITDTFFKNNKYMEDPYGRQRQLELQKNKINRSMEKQQKFIPNQFHSNVFNKNSKVYGTDVTFKQKANKQPKFNIYNHQANWKGTSPNKHGLYGFFTTFPKYMENPPSQTKRKLFDKKEVFKSMNSTLTTPSSSILANPVNMRKYTKSSISQSS